MIALIPARAGSKRLPGKNFRYLGGRPLLAWTVDAALHSGFDKVVVCTDAVERAEVSLAGLGPLTFYERPPVPDDQADIEWVTEVMQIFPSDEYCLLRPTSPFRDAETIRRAVAQWNQSKASLDSLRAMRRSTETAWKQWEPLPRQSRKGYAYMKPVSGNLENASMPTQSLPQCYIQTGALEIAWAKTWMSGSLSGERVGCFYTEGPEAIDCNTEDDWAAAEAILARA